MSMPEISNTDVSRITDLPGEGNYNGCDPDRHCIVRDVRLDFKYCTRCGYALQSLVDWWGQELPGDDL